MESTAHSAEGSSLARIEGGQFNPVQSALLVCPHPSAYPTPLLGANCTLAQHQAQAMSDSILRCCTAGNYQHAAPLTASGALKLCTAG